MKLSIVIPALNEEEYLPKLLDDISSQEVAFDFEVIVVDSCSDDSTAKVAMRYGDRLNIQVIRASKKGVGLARNLGARQASGEFLLFLDADVRLPRIDFLQRIIEEQSRRGSEFMTTHFRADGNNLIDKWLYRSGSNNFKRLFKLGMPRATGCILFISKNLHDKIGGFNEDMRTGQDIDYSIRAGKIAKNPHFVSNLFVYASSRRFVRDGRWSMLAWNIKWISGGLISLPGMKEYRFGHYKNKEGEEGEKEEAKELKS